MKIIELLSKIANGEEVPKKIRYDGRDMFWCEPCKIYEIAEVEQNELCGKDLYNILDNLNDEIEIIEEDKKIPEKLECVVNENGEFSINGFTFDYEQKIQIIDTVNQVIDYLKSKGE